MFRFQLRSGVRYLAMLTAACMLALSAGVGDALAQSVTNDSPITTGLFSTVDDATIINNSTITLPILESSCGVAIVLGSNATVTNNGTITTVNKMSSGICAPSSNADNLNITNAVGGTITTSGAHNNASGIQAAGSNTTITNAGSIMTTGSDASGISTETTADSAGSGADMRITNEASGTIATTGAGAYGINSAGNAFSPAAGSNAILTNAGTITTAGAIAYGIFSNGADAMITNSGTITTTGANAHGIVADGDNATITISGTVSATGTGSYAVKGSNEGDQKLILLPGANLVGQAGLVDLGTDPNDVPSDNDVIELRGNVVFDRDRAVGVERYKITGVDMGGGDSGGDTGGGGMIVTLDPTGSSATRRALGSVTGQIRRQVFQRLGTALPAATEDNGGWATVFVARAERNEDGQALAFDQHFYGVIGGYDGHLNSGQRVGLFAGVGQGQVKTDAASIKDAAERVFVGVYGQYAMGDLSLDGTVTLGYARHDASRIVADNVNGIEIADGEYNSVYISPSLALVWPRDMGNGLELRPRAQIAYTYGYYGSYTESGTTNANISFDSRNVNIIDGRLQLALAQSFAGERGEIEWRGGATLTHYGNDSVDASIGGGPVISYRVPGDETIPGGFTGINLRYAISDRVTLGVDVEYARTSGDAAGTLSGQLGLKIRF